MNENKIQNNSLRISVRKILDIRSPAWYRQLCNLGKPQPVEDNGEKILLKSVHHLIISSYFD